MYLQSSKRSSYLNKRKSIKTVIGVRKLTFLGIRLTTPVVTFGPVYFAVEKRNSLLLLESVPEALSDGCRVGATHQRKALVFGGLHPPYECGFRPFCDRLLVSINAFSNRPKRMKSVFISEKRRRHVTFGERVSAIAWTTAEGPNEVVVHQSADSGQPVGGLMIGWACTSLVFIPIPLCVFPCCDVFMLCFCQPSGVRRRTPVSSVLRGGSAK